MRTVTVAGFIVVFACVLLTALGSAFATHTASGGGTYEVATDISSQFQFSPDALQCKVAQAGAPPELQMFMFTTAIDSFVIDDNTVTIIGELASTTVTAEGPCVNGCTEIVGFTAVGVDNGTPGAGVDAFFLEVAYNGPQKDLFSELGFGDPAMFGAILASGDVDIHQ